MTDKKISQLPAASVVNGVDLGVIDQGGESVSFELQLLVALLQASIVAGAVFTFGTVVPQNTSGKIGDVFIKTDTATFYQKNSLGSWSAQWSIPVQGDGTVLYGIGVPDPSLGKNKDTYIATDTGIFYSKVINTWTQFYSASTGPQGPQGIAGTDGIDGVDGNTILYGSTNPSNGLGVDGNFYLNTSTYVLFGPKASGVWGTGQSLIPTIPPANIEIEIPFTAVTGFSINWQTDIPPGQTQTYAALLGNGVPKPLVVIPTDNPNEYTDLSFTRTYTKISGNIGTVIFDWAISQTGLIIF